MERIARWTDHPAFVGLREHAAQCLLIALNIGAKPRTIALPQERAGSIVLSTLPDRVTPVGSAVALAPSEGFMVGLRSAPDRINLIHNTTGARWTGN